ncbi:pectinesterase inhibitor-like [Dorcoceras hygrometricum]|nr:pectinesterase inhibitor-like [Dorcoceras hygrometricum]
MASPRTTIALSITLIATTLFIPSATSTAVNPFCRTADDKTFCTSLAKGAKTWEEAMTNALKSALQTAKAAKSITDLVGSKLPSGFLPQTKESIDSTCQETYESLIDNIQSCMGFVKKDPYSSLRVYLSATSFSDCKDGLDEFGVSSRDVDHFTAEIQKLSSTLLAIVETKP